ncbi:MAG: hypothetical protein LW832_09095 [Parachlamydia sp.]|jgi:hypothetical protein|nr:hypothetical protein [Parachlamydia sp.]
MNINAPYDWKCHPEAEQWLLSQIERLSFGHPALSQLEKELFSQTSTRLFDWIDYIAIRESATDQKRFVELGFERNEEKGTTIFHHPGAQFPRVIFQPAEGIAVNVDSIADFIMARGGNSSLIEGVPFGNFRRCLISREGDFHLWAVERRGTQTVFPTLEDEQTLQRYQRALENWQTRCRANSMEEKAMEEALQLVEKMVEEVGQHRAAWTVLEGERRYWQARNTAGQIQKNRQDRLGLGWANHDHHTFRSSRQFFSQLVRLFERLGFTCREKFYAGEEAGWGAQVMENTACRLVLFLDVDLDPHEIAGDIAHEPLPALDQLGTIGLWCTLHGDSILKAGMHHLEAQFLFEELTEDLSKSGIKMMKPFSQFPYLKQAFTAGEMWPVDPEKIKALLAENKLTEEHAHKFLTHGALGSHLENLQRREGYKGFNQKNVSLIIKKTDPREATS